MRKIGIKKLTIEAFARFGSFASILNPTGDKMGASPIEFYRDSNQQFLGNANVVSYSACVVEQRPWIIDCSEYHNNTYESILIIDSDYLMHVAPAVPQGEMPYDSMEVFLVPKGTVITVKSGVWHQAGFPYKSIIAHILCALPERAYVNDCVFLTFPEDERIEVIEEFID